MKNNKKGFTLIELLAVIVVLAIIMVIATTQVTKTINKARQDSFKSSFDMMYKSMKTSALQGMTKEDAIGALDFSKDDYKVDIEVNSGTYTLTVCAADLSIKTTNNPDGTEVYTEDGTLKNGTKFEQIDVSSLNGYEVVTKHCIRKSYKVS